MLLAACAAGFLRAHAAAVVPPASGLVTLSVLSTTDLHGFVFPRNDRGGLALLAGYVNNLRAARAADGGAVLLLDSGDTFQGGIESDLSEGAIVVDAYNAMGYTAAAIGNHEFDFGAADLPGARQDPEADPRGAIKARAAQARFPFLAANLIDDGTGRAVEWPNVRPSVLIERAGLKVGLVGVMTVGGLRATLPANVRGLHLAPLVASIASEASRLRSAGADVVIVVAHAGGGCAVFGEPADLSSCDAASEIFQVARGLPAGLVDAIAAGHTHDGLAHVVNGIAIVQGYALGRAFGRLDLAVDPASHRVVAARPFAPREVCARQIAEASTCGAAPQVTSSPQYEGRAVRADETIASAMVPALTRVRELQATNLGIVLKTSVARAGVAESPLGNLFADALREGAGPADVAINNNSRGGLRADLPAGPLTFGGLYDVFPFDNRLVRLVLSGADLRRVLAEEMERGRPGALGLSGVRVHVACEASGYRVEIARADGRPVTDTEQLTLVAMDSLVSGPVFASVAPPGGFVTPITAPVAREIVEDWLRGRTGTLDGDEFVDRDHPRWGYPGPPSRPCQVP